MAPTQRDVGGSVSSKTNLLHKGFEYLKNEEIFYYFHN